MNDLITVKDGLIQNFYSGEIFGTFCWQCDHAKVKIPFEIKLPLAIITTLLMGATIRFSDTATLRKGILRFFLVEFTNNIFEVNGMVELENVKKSLF